MTNLNDLFARDMAFRDIVIETAARAIGSTSKEFAEEWLMAGGDSTKSAKRAAAVERVRKAKDAGTSIGYAIVGREYYPWEAYETLIELLTDDDGLRNNDGVAAEHGATRMTNLERLFVDSEQFRQAVSAFAFAHSDDCPTSPTQMVDWLMAPYVDAQSKDQSKDAPALSDLYGVLSDANDDLAPESDVTEDAVDANDENATCNNSGENVTHDSREKLEADVRKRYTHTVSTAMWPPSANKHTDIVSVSIDTVLGWLDRQAAITRKTEQAAWIQQANGLIHEANVRANELRDELAKRDKGIARLKRQRDEARDFLTSSENLNADLRAMNDALADDNDRLEAECDKLKRKEKQLSNELGLRDRAIELLQDVKQELIAERDNLAADLQDCERQRERLRQALGCAIDHAHETVSLVNLDGEVIG